MQQPDIEIYIKDSNREAISAWLATALDAPCQWQQKGRVSRCLCANIPVVWFEQAVGKWHSLLLESNTSPWADDAQCAQAAAAHLHINVRYAPNSWQEADGEIDTNCWLQVSADGSVETINWHTS
ncbi:MAG: hypothetical protein RBR45_07585 [Pseudomonas sp.]|jgi:hypothetical protein|nr:hypothetical protein [Pseudomonas sp.]